MSLELLESTELLNVLVSLLMTITLLADGQIKKEEDLKYLNILQNIHFFLVGNEHF